MERLIINIKNARVKMKHFRKIFIVSFLLLLFLYTCNITSIPKNIMLFQGEKYHLKTLLGINITQKTQNYEVVQASSNLSESNEKIGRKDYTLNLFGAIPLKEISVNVIPKSYVVPLGNVVGLKLYTSRCIGSRYGRNRGK
ncbi:MAG: hypothetical protein HFJ26_02660 [Clostridia bacterium]|nr:hypothetical protein [Clostridia bacterium]